VHLNGGNYLWQFIFIHTTEVKDKKKRKTRSLFPLSSTIDNRGKLQTQDDCVHLAQAKAKGNTAI